MVLAEVERRMVVQWLGLVRGKRERGRGRRIGDDRGDVGVINRGMLVVGVMVVEVVEVVVRITGGENRSDGVG